MAHPPRRPPQTKPATRSTLIVVALSLSLLGVSAAPAGAVPALPVAWIAGGLDAGSSGAGQSARMATDPSGNVAIVSGPAGGSALAVTSYSSSGALRWRATISPTTGTFVGDWVAAARNGDVVAVGHNVGSSGNPIAVSVVRYGSDGTFQWRKDIAGTLPNVGRLLVDATGNAFLAFNSVGDGQDIRVHKYDPAGGLVWSQTIATPSLLANDIATSLALSPDEADLVVTGSIRGGATWTTAVYDSATGTRKWLVSAPEGIGATDVVVDGTRVYVAGIGNVGITSYLSVVAYDLTSGTRLWRTDRIPADGTGAAGLRIAKAPDGSVVVTGQASRGFLDWYTVAFETTGAVRWEAVRDGGLNTDEIPAGLLVMADGTTVVTGRGGPNLPGGFIPGVTAGYSANGTLLWEAFALQATVWAAALPNGNVCATGGYDALVTCWSVAGTDASPTVGIDTPADGATVAGTVTVKTTAGDDIGVTSVEVFIDGASLGLDTGAGVNWDTTATTNGSHTITATATDTIGQTATVTITVSVDNSTPVVDIHIGDLDGLAADAGSSRYLAKVTAAVHDAAEATVSGATVSFSYTVRGRTLTSSCTTDSTGRCTATSRKLSIRGGGVTFTVTGVTRTGLTYLPGSNHDPDGDSTGSAILVLPPGT